MGVDKQKARRQRNIHLSVVCGKAADMKRFGLRKIDYFCLCGPEPKRQTATKIAEMKRLVVQKDPEGNGREKTETELNSDSKGNSMFQENDSLCCLCVPHALRSVPCLLNHALCNETRGPRYVHCV